MRRDTTARDAGHAEAGLRSRGHDDGRQRARRERRRLVRRRRSRGVRARRGLEPLATIVGAGLVADEFAYLARTPAKAAALALEQAGKSIDDVARVEINEAFASVACNSTRLLGADEEHRQRERRRRRARPSDRRLRRPHRRHARARAAPQRRRARPRRDLLRRRPGRRAAGRGLIRPPSSRPAASSCARRVLLVHRAALRRLVAAEGRSSSAGESWRKAPCREVEEETGLALRRSARRSAARRVTRGGQDKEVRGFRMSRRRRAARPERGRRGALARPLDEAGGARSARAGSDAS